MQALDPTYSGFTIFFTVNRSPEKIHFSTRYLIFLVSVKGHPPRFLDTEELIFTYGIEAVRGELFDVQPLFRFPEFDLGAAPTS
jgi:hypothetical protein